MLISRDVFGVVTGILVVLLSTFTDEAAWAQTLSGAPSGYSSSLIRKTPNDWNQVLQKCVDEHACAVVIGEWQGTLVCNQGSWPFPITLAIETERSRDGLRPGHTLRAKLAMRDGRSRPEPDGLISLDGFARLSGDLRLQTVAKQKNLPWSLAGELWATYDERSDRIKVRYGSTSCPAFEMTRSTPHPKRFVRPVLTAESISAAISAKLAKPAAGSFPPMPSATWVVAEDLGSTVRISRELNCSSMPVFVVASSVAILDAPENWLVGYARAARNATDTSIGSPRAVCVLGQLKKFQVIVVVGGSPIVSVDVNQQDDSSLKIDWSSLIATDDVTTNDIRKEDSLVGVLAPFYRQEAVPLDLVKKLSAEGSALATLHLANSETELDKELALHFKAIEQGSAISALRAAHLWRKKNRAESNGFGSSILVLSDWAIGYLTLIAVGRARGSVSASDQVDGWLTSAHRNRMQHLLSLAETGNVGALLAEIDASKIRTLTEAETMAAAAEEVKRKLEACLAKGPIGSRPPTDDEFRDAISNYFLSNCSTPELAWKAFQNPEMFDNSAHWIGSMTLIRAERVGSTCRIGAMMHHALIGISSARVRECHSLGDGRFRCSAEVQRSCSAVAVGNYNGPPVTVQANMMCAIATAPSTTTANLRQLSDCTWAALVP